MTELRQFPSFFKFNQSFKIFRIFFNYGYIPNTLAPDGEEIDAYVLGVDKPVKSFKGKVIAIIHRFNDDDDKLVVVPQELELTDEEIRKKTHFQEQWFKIRIVR